MDFSLKRLICSSGAIALRESGCSGFASQFGFLSFSTTLLSEGTVTRSIPPGARSETASLITFLGEETCSRT